MPKQEFSSETFATELFFNQLPKNVFVNCSSEDFIKSELECAEAEMFNRNNIGLKIYKGPGSDLAPQSLKSILQQRPEYKLTIYGGTRCHIGKIARKLDAETWSNSSLIIT